MTSRMQWFGSYILSHKGKILVLFVCVLLPLWLFGELAEDVVRKEAFGFDPLILTFAHQLASPSMNAIMLVASWLGLWGVAIVDALIPIALYARGKHYQSLFFALSVFGAALLNLGAKALFTRQRPDLWISIAPETTYSFPSGHAMGSMALATALVVLFWNTRWRWLVTILGAAFVAWVGFSRVYLGVHFPSDIIAGWSASLAWVVGLGVVLNRRMHPSEDKLAQPDVSPARATISRNEG